MLTITSDFVNIASALFSVHPGHVLTPATPAGEKKEDPWKVSDEYISPQTSMCSPLSLLSLFSLFLLSLSYSSVWYISLQGYNPESDKPVNKPILLHLLSPLDSHASHLFNLEHLSYLKASKSACSDTIQFMCINSPLKDGILSDQFGVIHVGFL